MIYLSLKIVGYLLAALLLGGAAGWLLRNVGATEKEEELRRRLAEVSMRAQQRDRQVRVRAAQRTTTVGDVGKPQIVSPAEARTAGATEKREPGVQRTVAKADGQQPRGELGEVRSDLEKITRERQSLVNDLERTHRRVSELERERELQDRSLRLLHQQLEVERQRRLEAAAG